VGHIRLAEDGPWGYGKYGSFEGFCSGGGIAHLGRMEAERALQNGKPPLFCRTRDELPGISAKSIAQALDRGDTLAASIYRRVGEYLGRGLALLIDIFNPEAIILGSIYVRQQKDLEKPMREQISREALSPSASTCCILPAGLGERVGDFASISVGIDVAEQGGGW
jgi:glucokinase